MALVEEYREVEGREEVEEETEGRRKERIKKTRE